MGVKGPKPKPNPGLKGQRKQKQLKLEAKVLREGLAALWSDARPSAVQVLKAHGIKPPAHEDLDLEDPDREEKVTLDEAVTVLYKRANKLKTLVKKKTKLQELSEKLKAEFEKSLEDLAAVSAGIAEAVMSQPAERRCTSSTLMMRPACWKW